MSITTAFQSPNGAISTFITKIDENATGMADLAVTLAPTDKLYPNTIISYVATVTNIGTIASSGPIRLQVNFAGNPLIRHVTGEGWYGFGQSPGNPVVMVYPGPLASGR